MSDQPTIEERQTSALESIAASLVKLSNLPMLVSEKDAALMESGGRSGSITYVDRFGRPTPAPDRTA